MLLTGTAILALASAAAAAAGLSVGINPPRRKPRPKTMLVRGSGGRYRPTRIKRRCLPAVSSVGAGGTDPESARDGNGDVPSWRADRRLVAGSLALGLAGGGLFVPALAWAGAGLAVVVMPPILRAGFWRAWRNRRITVDTLDSLIFVTCAATGQLFLVAWCAFVPTLTRSLVRRSQIETDRRLCGVYSQQARSVWLVLNDSQVQVPLGRLRAGDIVAVSAGETMPVDGEVISGTAILDISALTGELQPVEVSEGASVRAPALIVTGRVHVRAAGSGEETIAAEIARHLKRADDYTHTVEVRGEAHANRVSPPTFLAGGVAAPLLGWSTAVALWNSVPGYMYRIVAPIGVMNALASALDQGVLIRDGRVLELLRRVDTIVLDKTGTVTTGELRLAEIVGIGAWSELRLLALAAKAEFHQDHPIAIAIRKAAQNRGLVLAPPDWVDFEIGLGLRARIDGLPVHIGSLSFLSTNGVSIPAATAAAISGHLNGGNTVVGVAVDHRFAGYLSLAPRLRPEAQALIARFRRRGMRVYLMSGDQEEPTRTLALQLGVDGHFAEQLPQNKGRIVKNMQEGGRIVCFVGDGLNDSVALRQAHVSVAFGNSPSLALESAHVVLLNQDLQHISTVLDLAHFHDGAMRRAQWATIIPGCASAVGALFLGTGLLTSIFLNQVGLWTGLAISVDNDGYGQTDAGTTLDLTADAAVHPSADASATV